jgi:thiosulfate reductase/polysulfide reductase chain A
MGSVESKGGLFFKKGPGEVGGKADRKLTEQQFDQKIEAPRFDKVGTQDFPLPDPNHGVAQMLPHAILNEDPYPIKALFAYRIEPARYLDFFDSRFKSLVQKSAMNRFCEACEKKESAKTMHF